MSRSWHVFLLAVCSFSTSAQIAWAVEATTAPSQSAYVSAGLALAPTLGAGYARQLSALQGFEVEANYSPKNWSGNLTTALLGVRYLFMPMQGTFHVSLGATYRHMNNNARETYSFVMANGQSNTTEGATWTSSLDQIDAEVFVGNEWKIDKFVFGCDWVGTGFRLWKIASTFKNDSGSSVVSSASRDDHFRNQIGLDNWTFTLHVLKFRVGMVF
jgi:hypothetical protein